MLAYGAPVSSRSGSASSSQRSRTAGPLPLTRTPVTPVPPMPVVTVKPLSLQPAGDALGGVVLLVGEFGVAVQVLVERLLVGPQRLVAGQHVVDDGHYRSPPEKISRKNKNTFSTSRKIEAASRGAVLVSVLVRSRWKSNMVNPAKMTRPRTE